MTVLERVRKYPRLTSIILLVITALAYGTVLPKLGFYWDDLPILWIRFRSGPEALAKYFATNRPVWGLLHQFTTASIPATPIYWQILALLLRWLTALLVLKLVQRLSPPMALGASLLLLLYPGFNGHSASYVFGHFYIVLSFFLLSMLFMLKGGWNWTIPALFCSALNLWMMEYFFFLELIRPVVLWIALTDSYPDRDERIRRVVSLWFPYLSLFIFALFSRIFIHNNQTYAINLLEKSDTTPLNTVLNLGGTVLSSMWTAAIASWGQILQISNLAAESSSVLIVYVGIVMICSALVFIYMFSESREVKQSRCLEIIVLGLIALALAGIPFWITSIPIKLAFPANRATLPFMLGSSLLLVSLFQYIPMRIRILLFSVLVGLAAGRHFLWSSTFQREWQSQKDLFWQMAWRAPSLQPNTIVLLNDRALYFEEQEGEIDLVDRSVFRYYADNSLSAVLNWVYDRDQTSEEIPYVLFYPKSRIGGSLPGIQAGLPILYDYLVGTFKGNTSQLVVFYYAPPGCLRLVDPEIDSQNELIPTETLIREASRLSSSHWVGTATEARLPDFYAPEPEHGWCFYFEKADLARQHRDWEQVVNLGNSAFALNPSYIAPIERFTFIEGYAHTGDWERALELSTDEFMQSPNYAGPLLCRLWDRIEAETRQTQQKDLTLIEIRKDLNCH